MSSKPTLYFGYGSNMWLDQMDRRCPGSVFLGIAVLSGFKWIINECGYATLISSEADVVYGSIYSLTPPDEESLDGYEGVPDSYVKEYWVVDFTSKQRPDSKGADGVVPDGASASRIECLVYIDRERPDLGPIRAEYIVRMNRAITDGIACGIPKAYMDKYLRPFVPEPLF